MSVGQRSEERPSDEDLNELIASYRSLLAGQMNDPHGDVRALTERARASSNDCEFIALVLGKLARKSLRGETPRYGKDSVRPFELNRFAVGKNELPLDSGRRSPLTCR